MNSKSIKFYTVPVMFAAALALGACSADPMMSDDGMDKGMDTQMDDTMQGMDGTMDDSMDSSM